MKGSARGEVNAAAIISLFPEENEAQRQAAALFNTEPAGAGNRQKEKEKALHDILLSVKTDQLRVQQRAPGQRCRGIWDRVIAGKKALEELSKTHISLD